MLGEGEPDGVDGGLELLQVHGVRLQGVDDDDVLPVDRVGAVDHVGGVQPQELLEELLLARRRGPP